MILDVSFFGLAARSFNPKKADRALPPIRDAGTRMLVKKLMAAWVQSLRSEGLAARAVVDDGAKEEYFNSETAACGAVEHNWF